jgi:hypothetical protein
MLRSRWHGLGALDEAIDSDVKSHFDVDRLGTFFDDESGGDGGGLRPLLKGEAVVLGFAWRESAGAPWIEEKLGSEHVPSPCYWRARRRARSLDVGRLILRC